MAAGDTTKVPPFIQGILNPDNIVQIGEYIYQLNFNNKTAYGILCEDSSLIQNLVKGDYSNNKIIAIPFHLSALQIMDSIKLNPEKQGNAKSKSEFWGWFCGDRYARAFTKDYGLGQAYYGTYGVWFKLSGSVNATYGRLIFSARQRARCGSENSSYTDNSGANRVERTPYESTIALQKYSFAMNAYNLNTGQVEYLSAQDGY